MDKFNGIGPNFRGVERKGLVDKKKTEGLQDVAKKSVESDLAKQVQHKNPDQVLNAMHAYGVMNMAAPKVKPIQNDLQMNQRIGEFMQSFENEVEKGLKMFNEEFPGHPETFARQIAAEAAFKAAEL